MIASLRDAGFHDILPAHLGVFQHPGPEGRPPGVLARRTSASKQAMNHLLHQLVTGGYLTRETNHGDRRSRVVRLTEHGRAAQAVIEQTLTRLDRRWREALGDQSYRHLARGLGKLSCVLDTRAKTRGVEGQPPPETGDGDTPTQGDSVSPGV